MYLNTLFKYNVFKYCPALKYSSFVSFPLAICSLCRFFLVCVLSVINKVYYIFSSYCFMFNIFIFYQTTIIIWKKKLYIFLMCIYFLMYIFYILHTASTDDVLLRNLAKVWMSKDELDNNCFSILTKILLPKK